MLTPYRKPELGHIKNNWLDSRFHFSFGEYYNPDRMGFETLRVVNDDHIRAGSGFDFHPHRDMEIITYVRKGTIIHQDNLGNHGRTDAGDVQVMSAGRGIVHAETSDATSDTTLFQIWIRPRERGIAPRWDQKAFPKTPVSKDLNLLVSGREADSDKDVLMIHQDAAIYGGRLNSGTKISHALKGPAYLILSEGCAEINGTRLDAGDAAEITEEASLDIAAKIDSEILLIEL